MQRIIPKKGDFRMRAHINPFNTPFFPFPKSPLFVNWRQHFPLHFGGSRQENLNIHCNTDLFPCNYENQHSTFTKKIDILDIGCGYGGLLFALAPLFPSKLIFGMEIRDKLVNYAAQKIKAYRILYPQKYDHISVVRANCMKHLCHYITKQSVQKMFICFPDPHFKSKNYKRRIINTGFLSQYAYLLKKSGRIYCITDVQELHSWHIDHLRSHSQFQQVNDEDQCLNIMINSTEQSQKVDRKNGRKYWAIFKKV